MLYEFMFFEWWYRDSAVKALNSINKGSHVKLNSLQQKTKMPGAPKLQSLLKIAIGQNNQLFMGNILATSDFFIFSNSVLIAGSHMYRPYLRTVATDNDKRILRSSFYLKWS